MYGKIKVYVLFKNKSFDEYILCEFIKEHSSNVNENESIKTNNKLYDQILCFKNLNNLHQIGIMEYFPVGDKIYEAKNLEEFDIFYCLNNLNTEYLILGTGKDKEQFISEAIEDFPEEVNLKDIKKVKIKFYKNERK